MYLWSMKRNYPFQSDYMTKFVAIHNLEVKFIKAEELQRSSWAQPNHPTFTFSLLSELLSHADFLIQKQISNTD